MGQKSSFLITEFYHIWWWILSHITIYALMATYPVIYISIQPETMKYMILKKIYVLFAV